MQQFRPPINNPAFMAFCKWGLPLELFRAGIEVEVAGDGVERFQRLRDKRTVLICNHPDQHDPEAVFAFSKIVNEDFNFIAARECFNWWLGLTGLCFQNIGVYSVVRGEADLRSFKTSREIIARGERKLVVFPEAEVTRQPDTLLPFRPGATQLFFEGQEELLRTRPNEPVFVLPVATRWRYKHDISASLHSSLRRIEERLRIAPSRAAIAERVSAANSAMLAALEEEYFCAHLPRLPFEKRVNSLLSSILSRVANLLQLDLPPDEIPRDWLRRVSNAIRQYIEQDTSSMSAYQQDLHRKQAEKLRAFVKDVHRIQHFIGVSSGLDSRPQTQERLASAIAKMELEVLGKISDKGKRIVRIGVGEPISLLGVYDDYLRDRSTAIAKTSAHLQSTLQALVDELDNSRVQTMIH